ncbi:hypothetical protein GCM10023259_095300 [Thermocatellispora tengchongensis]
MAGGTGDRGCLEVVGGVISRKLGLLGLVAPAGAVCRAVSWANTFTTAFGQGLVTGADRADDWA